MHRWSGQSESIGHMDNERIRHGTISLQRLDDSESSLRDVGHAPATVAGLNFKGLV